MEAPLFSQIPSVILKKLNPDEFHGRNQRKVKFLDDIDEITILDDHEEVTSSFRGQSQESDAISPVIETKAPVEGSRATPRETKSTISGANPLPIRTRLKAKSDSNSLKHAFKTVKEEPISTIKDVFKFSEESIQIDSPKLNQDDNFESNHHNNQKLVSTGTQTIVSSFEKAAGRCDQCQARMDSLIRFKPMYSFPKNVGKGPPLKIGLTLPKGRKRKVFYPDEEKELAEGG